MTLRKPADPVITNAMTAELFKCFGKSERFYFRWKVGGQWNQSAVFYDSKDLAVASIQRLGFGKYLFDNAETLVSSP